ncbi:hypothetical protein Acr_00g0042450 [Actinidia rufa]|uniref:Uncharacterized protein n=1 Tax=Actinidia rufa TaxID=165716 RepID=A0A7J0DK37_9ERIC|nr:hypothetical protein Acr_00g0042450 [Actinidia rufa]
MMDEVNQLLSSPPKESPPRDKTSNQGESGEIDNCTPFEKEFNIMTKGDLDRLRESYIFPPRIQARLPKEGETILSTRSSDENLELLQYLPGTTSPQYVAKCRLRIGGMANYKVALSLNEFRGGREGSSSSQGTIGSFLRTYLGRKEFLGSRDHRAPQGMASSGGDNVEDKSANGTAIVAGDEAMSKRINLKKLAQKVDESKGVSSLAKSTPIVKGVVIREKRLRDEVSDVSPSKVGSKGKEALPPPETKKAKSSATSSVVTIKGAKPAVTPGEGTLANPDTVLGPRASILGSPSMGVVLESSLVVRSREMGDEVTLYQGQGTSFEGKMSRAHKLACELEGQLAEMALAKKTTAQEYKSLKDFQEAVEAAASKYFGEGFDCCKRQIAHHYPNLGFDLEIMGIDHDLIEEEEETEKKEEDKEKGEDKGNTAPLSP